LGKNLVSPQNIGNVLFCSSLVEKKTYEMYYALSQKVENSIVRTLLVSVAQDSLKHSSLFAEISKEFVTSPPKEKECKSQLGELWRNINSVTKFVGDKKIISSEELLELIKNLSHFEYYMGEEYNIMEKVKTLKYMSEEISTLYGIDFDDAFGLHKSVFESIINDELKHREILVDIVELLIKELAPKVSHPKVKYQTPDAWIFQPPNKEIR
jgi:rubrerythrin